MVDDDKKKDLDNDYSALSDALESGEPAPSLEDLLKDHGIDLGSDIDLDAMQDFSLSESAKTDKPDDFSSLFDDHTNEPADRSNDNLFDDHFNDNLFDEPAAPVPPSRPAEPRARERAPEPMMEPFDHFEEEFKGEPSDTNMFEASDFDDVNASHHDVDLGGDPLFDYDPQGEATEATFADVGGADGGDFGGNGGDMPPPDKGPGAKRIFIRLGMMLVLVSVIYGGLRFFLAEKAPAKVANAPEAKMTPSEIAHLATPASPASAPATTTTTTTTPALVAAAPVPPPETPAVTPAPIPETATTTPPATPAIAAATTTTTTTTPAPAIPIPPEAAPANSNAPDMHAAEASPMTSMNVAVPIESITNHGKHHEHAAPISTQETLVATTTTTTSPAPTAQSTPTQPLTMGTGDVNNKLDNLELALKSIDQRLSQVGTGGVGEEKIQRLERLVNDASAPEMQDVLQQAVKKMKELDRKLERISELQHQVRMLDTDVKMLKEDVLTQTNMVGEQQRLFNDNVQIAQMQEPGPVKMVVQAAIPGRAWLRSERGELLTVIPGDEVPGYGRVVSIDAASGTVVTSSRAVFREQ